MDDRRQQNIELPIVESEHARVTTAYQSTGRSIEAEEILNAQTAWAKGVVETGSLFLTGDDYVAHAQSLIDSLYGHDDGPVLFKPTLATRQPFRFTKSDTISYFIGGAVDEDLGFALRPWQHVRFGAQHIVLGGTTALAMGHYYFTEYNLGQEVQAEFTFGFYRSGDGTVRINLQHSSLPHTLPKAAPVTA